MGSSELGMEQSSISRLDLGVPPANIQRCLPRDFNPKVLWEGQLFKGSGFLSTSLTLTSRGYPGSVLVVVIRDGNRQRGHRRAPCPGLLGWLWVAMAECCC